MDLLSQAAREAGVSEKLIEKYNNDFLASYNEEYNSARWTNPKDMEKALDSLRGEILTKQNSSGNISEEAAASQVRKMAMNEHIYAAMMKCAAYTIK